MGFVIICHGLFYIVWLLGPGFCYVAHGFWCYDELSQHDTVVVSLCLLVVLCVHRRIYVYLKLWILSSRNICPVPLLCAGIFLKEFLLHVWLNATLQYYLWHDLCLYYSALHLLLTRRLHYWVLHDVNYIHRACAPGTWYFMRVCVVFLRDVMTFTYYVLSRNFIFMYVMPYISIWCQLYLHTTRCPGTWYFMPDSVVYFYVMSLASIYCEHSRNLTFYVRQCHLSTTWFHHTLRLSREIYMLYWCCL